MTTGIRGLNNQSNSHVSVVNTEHPGDSKTVAPHSTNNDVYAWISQHKDKPLSVQTGRGRCIVWDQNWQIRAEWADGTGTYVLADVKHSPQDFRMTVDANGNISLQ